MHATQVLDRLVAVNLDVRICPKSYCAYCVRGRRRQTPPAIPFRNVARQPRAKR